MTERKTKVDHGTFKTGDVVVIYRMFGYIETGVEEVIIGMATVEKIAKRMTLDDGSRWYVPEKSDDSSHISPWKRWGYLSSNQHYSDLLRPAREGDRERFQEQADAERKKEEDRKKRQELTSRIRYMATNELGRMSTENLDAIAEYMEAALRAGIEKEKARMFSAHLKSLSKTENP